MTDFISPLHDSDSVAWIDDVALWLALACQVAVGALWRGVLDGWKSWAEWSMRVRWLHWLWDWSHDEPVLRRSAIVVAGVGLTWPLWLWLPWVWALMGSATALLYYVMGHTVDRWTVWLRYLGVGALGYWAAKRWWPREWMYGDFIDGWMRVGALWAGGVGWGAVFLVGWVLR